MKAQGKYVQLLEHILKLLEEQVAEARKDVEFYRGKVERLELSLMSGAPMGTAAQVDYLQRTDQPKIPASIHPLTPPPRMPFAEVKRKWNALTAEEQEKAVAEGRLEFEKEENNAGS